MALPRLSMEGRLTADPELRYTEGGLPICTFTIVNNDRKKNDQGEWEDVGDPLFIRVTAWRKLGENCSESLSKGDLVVASGKLQNRKYEDREGNARTSLEMNADSVAVSLQFRIVKHGQAQRGSGKRNSDPWSGDSGADDEPPF